jgi:pSer/pThr/pTyr-binding forkhead associated (FHA) protein
MRTETRLTTTASIPAKKPAADLDRTDELPVLDVEAYEATLADNQKGLGRTDTWSVEALHDVEELAESAQQSARVAARPTASGNEALTVNVERILKRIADVEADIVAAQDANAALQKRGAEILADRDQHIERVRSLDDENARLREHRALADEMAQRLEQQLRAQLQQAAAEIAELQSARAAERQQANEQREQLERQLALLSERGETLQESQRTLQDQLRAASAITKQRTDALAGIEKSLLDEKNGNAQLARQFAAKLKDCEMLTALVEARNRSIDELTHERDDLVAQLARAAAADAQLSAELATAREGLDADRALLAERGRAIAQKDRQIAELTADLDRAGTDLQSARQQQEAAASALAALDSTHSKSLGEMTQVRTEMDALRAALQAAERRDAEVQQELSTALVTSKEARQKRTEMEKRLKDAQKIVETLTEERDAAQAQVTTLREERETLLPASDQLDALNARLHETGRELEQAREELAAAHADATAGVQELNEQSEEIEALRAKIEEHDEAVHLLEETVEARDELIAGLTQQLQTARDERAIMSTQLEKSRARVKSMTQQIFSRDNQIAALQADLAVYTEALAAIRRDVNRIGEDSTQIEPGEEVERVLEPVGHDGAPIFLSGEMFTIGRTSENDIAIPSKLVSRHHARLLVGPTGVILEDAGSTNGCFVNGEQVRQHLMRDGDVLELGDIRYRLCIRPTHGTKVRANVVSLNETRPVDE